MKTKSRVEFFRPQHSACVLHQQPKEKLAWQRVQDQIESKFLHRAYNFQDVLLSRVKDNNLTYSTTQCSPSCPPPWNIHWWFNWGSTDGDPPRASTIGWRPQRVTASVTIWYPRPQTTNETDGFFWNIPSGFGKNLLSKPDIDIRIAPTTDLGNSQSDVS